MKEHKTIGRAETKDTSLSIERITRVELRSVWQHEAQDFTTWLERNLDLLNDHLAAPLDPENVQREAGAGAFNVDLVAEDDDGRTVVIENQLGRSDHDHLGKIITYQAMLDADVVIWIVGDARPEHVAALTWLNASTPLAAYLLQLEAIRIGDSNPAPLLTILVRPSDETRQAASSKAAKSERHGIRRRFWTALLNHAADRTPLHANISPGDGPYQSASSGIRGLNWTYGLRQHETQVILWIDRGPDTHDVNTQLFEQLKAHRSDIEAAFGQPLDWRNETSNRSCTIRHQLDLGGWRDEDDWPEIIEATVDAMTRLADALDPHLRNLQLP